MNHQHMDRDQSVARFCLLATVASCRAVCPANRKTTICHHSNSIYKMKCHITNSACMQLISSSVLTLSVDNLRGKRPVETSKIVFLGGIGHKLD